MNSIIFRTRHFIADLRHHRHTQAQSLSPISRERRAIFFIILCITLFGLLMVYESSSIYAYRTTADPAHFFKRQFAFSLIGVAFLFLTLFADLESLRKKSKEILLFTFLLLGLVLLVSKKVGGARRWIQLFGFNFQPSELLKISFLLYCADYARRKGILLKDFKKGLLPLLVVLSVIFTLLVVQPDLGTALFWISWTLLFLFLHRARGRHLLVIIILGVVLSFFLIKFYPYRFRRIIAYLNPFADPKGAGFQLIQSQIAFGQGGILGVGLGGSLQKLFFLPAAHTDFIYSIIAEEFGLWGSLGLLALYFFLIHKMFMVAINTKNAFRRSILLGIVFIFFLEVTINIGVSCGFFPTKGLSLPLVSYGGSSLVIHYVLIGLFFNASKEVET
ncbi:MAG: putative lipid II flippase FtsW [Candidatus Omnitrophota bacterium]|nr:MAG: putative lipid II flippase FtsW [Candidatus Omnitrophota bacterium]